MCSLLSTSYPILSIFIQTKNNNEATTAGVSLAFHDEIAFLVIRFGIGNVNEYRCPGVPTPIENGRCEFRAKSIEKQI
jgi:hypothetical protein